MNPKVLQQIRFNVNFLNPTLATHLKQNLLQLLQENKLQTAGTGNENEALINANNRNDKESG